MPFISNEDNVSIFEIESFNFVDDELSQVEPIEVLLVWIEESLVETDGQHTAVGELFVDAPHSTWELEVNVNPYGSAVWGEVEAWS